MEKSWYLGIGLSMAVLLTGCGGGGGSSSDDGDGGPDRTPGMAKAGLYQGAIVRGSENQGQLILVHNGDGTATFVNSAGATYAKGLLEFEGDGFIGVLTQFRSGRPLSSGAEGSMEGESYRNFFRGESYRERDGEREEQSSFAFQRRADVSDMKPSLEKAAGSWEDTVEDAPVTTISINSDGVLNGGGGGAKCSFNGQVSIPDPAVNIYRVTYSSSNCQDTSSTLYSSEEQDGTFNGYGFILPGEGSGSQFVILADNGEINRSYRFE